MNHKKISLALIAILISQVISARDWILDTVKPWPKLWKIVLVLFSALFITLAIVNGLDLLPELLSIFNVDISL